MKKTIQVLINFDKDRVWQVKATENVEIVLLNCDTQEVIQLEVFKCTPEEIADLMEAGREYKKYKKQNKQQND